MVHAQFDHRHFVLRAQAQQGQRHADIVVQVAWSPAWPAA